MDAQTNVQFSATLSRFSSLKVMRRIVLSAVMASYLLASVSASGASPGRLSAKCSPRSAHLLVVDTLAQIYTTPTTFGHRDVYGCAYGAKHPYLLGPARECGTGAGRCVYVEREALAGSVVAYEEAFLGMYDSSWMVAVRDLRSGRLLHKVPTGVPSPLVSGLVGNGFTVDIVPKSDGAVAWTVESGIKPSRYEVHAVDKNGSRVLASGQDIGPHSLALAGSTLYWTQGGKPFSTVLN